MKILALSLLRYGDIFSHIPAILHLRKRYPEAEIHLLINEQFQNVSSILEGVDRIHLFKRNHYQKTVQNHHSPIMTTYLELNDFIESLNDIGFDQVINLTHNRLSALIGSRVRANRYEGMFYSKGKYNFYGSPWWKELSFHSKTEGLFSFSEILYRAVGGQGLPQPRMRRTENGIKEASQYTQVKAKRVLVQALTSDTKKDWGLKNFEAFVEALAEKNNDAEFVFLCAPNEAQTLLEFQHRLVSNGHIVHLAPIGFAGVLSLLDQADLLVTGDTSIKHLALATKCPILEIALGSSSVAETGVNRPDSVLVQSRELCSPCDHFRDCIREKHFCSERVSPQMLSEIASSMLSSDWLSLREVADSERKECIVFSSVYVRGMNHRCQIGGELSYAIVRLWNRLVWDSFNSKRNTPIAIGLKEMSSIADDFGSEVFVAPLVTQVAESVIAESMDIETESYRADSQLEQLQLSLAAADLAAVTSEELKTLLLPILSLADSGGFLRRIRHLLLMSESVNTRAISLIRDSLKEVRTLCQIRINYLCQIEQSGRADVQFRTAFGKA